MSLIGCRGDCGAARAKDEEITRLTAQVTALQDRLLALADLGAYRAVRGPGPTPPPPRPRPTVPLAPWAQSAIGDGAVDIHAEKRRLEREWRDSGGQPVSPATAEG